MGSIESFYGRVENEADCVVLIDLARRGLVPRVQRRLTSRKRRQIRHGSIFIYCEEESRIRRWTDDMSWTPSRVQGVFLVYRQLLTDTPMVKKTYSATCAGRSFHVVGYLQAPCLEDIPSVSALYRGVDFPTDIRIKKKFSFQEEAVANHATSVLEPPDQSEDLAFDAYWY